MKKALTIRQPWAWLTVNGFKDVENRSWPTKYRGPLYIHAALREPRGELMDSIEKEHRLKIPDAEIRFGGIIGVVDLIDCVDHSASPWFTGPFGFVLANPRKLRFQPMPGRLGLFAVP